MSSVDVCSAPHAFSYLCSARRYIASASAILPWVWYRLPRLLTVSSVDVCSAPHASSFPCSARRYIASASAILPWA